MSKLAVAVTVGNGCEGILDESYAVKLTDLTIVDLGYACVLVRLNPLLALTKVVSYGRMNNSNVLATNLRNSVLLKLGCSLCYHLRSKKAGLVKTGLVGRSSCSTLIAVHNVGVSKESVSDKSLLSLCRRCAHLLGCAKDDVIVCSKLENVRNGSVCTILIDRAGKVGHAEGLTAGNYTLLKLVSLCEGVPLSPLNGLTVAGGKGLLLCKLCVEHLNTSILKKLGVIECLNGRVKCAVGGLVYHSVYLSEKLKVKVIKNVSHIISPS